jgi:hypothetical protein
MNDSHESERPPWKTYGEVSHPTVGRRISGRSGGPTGNTLTLEHPGAAETPFKLVNTVQHRLHLPQQTKFGTRKKKHVYLRVNNTTPRQALKEKEGLHATAPKKTPPYI